jgi:hypothetical protein
VSTEYKAEGPQLWIGCFREKEKFLTVPGNWLRIPQLSSLQPVTTLTCLPAPLAAVSRCWKLSEQWDITSIQSVSRCCALTLQVRREHCYTTDIAVMHSSFNIPLERWPCVKVITTSLHVWEFFSKQHTKSITQYLLLQQDTVKWRISCKVAEMDKYGRTIRVTERKCKMMKLKQRHKWT